MPISTGEGTKIGLITISKPIWFYGLESLAAQILPPKDGKLRRIAFAQLALPGHGGATGAAGAKQGEDELGRLSRGLPLWFAETLYFSPLYAPVVAVRVATGLVPEELVAATPRVNPVCGARL